MPSVAALTDAVARHSGLPASRVRTVSRRLQDAGVLPRSNSRVPPEADISSVVSLIVALLTDEPLHSVASAAEAYLAYSNTDADGTMVADELLAKMLTGLADFDTSCDLTKLTMRSAISVVSGARPALVVRAGNIDEDPVEWALTADGTPWRPELANGCQKSLSIGGFALFRIVSELGLGIERRTFPAAFTVAA